MGTDGENKDKPFDEISDLLKRFYKPGKEINTEEFWEKVSKKIDSLFHKEVLSEKTHDSSGAILSEEGRYWLGLEEYIKNEISSLKHKTITDHLLQCNECRKNYVDLLDKKKPVSASSTGDQKLIINHDVLNISFV